jgi:hypothetical protein
MPLVAGCDPGYHYRAVNQDKNEERWSRTVEGVRFGGGLFGSLTGCREFFNTLSVQNDSLSEVEVLGGTVTSNCRTFVGKLCYKPPDCVIPPRVTRTVHLFFDLSSDTVYDVLGPTIVWTWRVRIGNKAVPIVVEMAREQ